ncbi:general substrate transporter [Jimgerdemannia flammicorona]|uniref:General substrate transporter n=2 Tax=Jimgerdemannia flammicorona TaxID=994334 RepID=A0A433QDB6_9FUNG|nr:general substrate transporter [Jimgerdemannia flammicorona]RUS27752.1 general substrate transporter [Jimgerdemannia flammicorona]
MASNIYLIGGFAAIAGLLFGFDIGSNSGIIGTKIYQDYFNHPDGTEQGTINGAMSIGCFVGSLASGYFGDYVGRKWSIAGSGLLFAVGALIQALSNGVGMLIAGRLIAGLSVGLTSMMVPLYQSEVAPKEIRGRLVSIQQWAITWGIFIAFWIQYGCSYIPDTSSFRIPYGVLGIPGLILAVGMIWFPESPRFLADKNRNEEALQILANLHGNGDINNEYVQREWAEIQETIRFEREEAAHSYLELFKPKMIKRVFLGVALQAWQQLTGMNIIMFYVVYLFNQAGVVGQEATLQSSGVSYVVNVVATIPAILYVDKWGRRPTLIYGAFAMSVCLFIVGGVMGGVGTRLYDDVSGKHYYNFNGNTSATYVIIIFVYIFVACFAVSWGPVGWIYPAEIYPNRIRAKAVSLSTASNWFFNWLLNFFVPNLMEDLGYGLYVLFGAFNLAMSIHVYFQYPETKGYTLEEMDQVFATSVSPRKSHVKQVKDVEAPEEKKTEI